MKKMTKDSDIPINKKYVLFSIGKIENKKSLLPYIKRLSEKDKYILFATNNTYKFLKENKVETFLVYKISQKNKKPNIGAYLDNNIFDLIINIPTHEYNDLNGEKTDGKSIRKKALETGTSLITNMDVAIMVINKLSS